MYILLYIINIYVYILYIYYIIFIIYIIYNINGNPLQYSCLENVMDRGAWLATVHRVAEMDMTSLVAQMVRHLTTMLETLV